MPVIIETKSLTVNKITMRNAILFLCMVSMGLSLSAAHPKDATKNTDPVRTSDSKRWKKGFIVTLKGDTIEGKIKTPDLL
jgi:hypothetical protein